MNLNKEKLGRFIIIIVALIITLIPIMWHFLSSESQLAVLASGKTSVNRIEFLKSFGWEVSSNVSEESVTIPVEFSDIYENYNDLQRSQGYDLRDFKGKTVIKYTYEVINYPHFSDDDLPLSVVANILVYEDKIIGGDVCSMELAGFLHGFELPSS